MRQRGPLTRIGSGCAAPGCADLPHTCSLIYGFSAMTQRVRAPEFVIELSIRHALQMEQFYLHMHDGPEPEYTSQNARKRATERALLQRFNRRRLEWVSVADPGIEPSAQRLARKLLINQLGEGFSDDVTKRARATAAVTYQTGARSLATVSTDAWRIRGVQLYASPLLAGK